MHTTPSFFTPSISETVTTMWALDVDNFPHPHLSLESSDNIQNPNAHSPAGRFSGSSTDVKEDNICRPHEHYFFADDNVIFQVEHIQYKIHRYFFQRDSEIFASIFALHAGPGQSSADYNPIRLIGVKVRDFDLFLSMLYPAEIGVYLPTTVEEWTSVLDLAAKWKFDSIKTFAIEKLANDASPIDKIVLGRRYNIDDWLTDAYRAVCKRPQALTLEEAKLLGMEDVVKISSLRQDIIRDKMQGRPLNARTDVLSIDELVQRTFGLENPFEQDDQQSERSFATGAIGAVQDDQLSERSFAPVPIGAVQDDQLSERSFATGPKLKVPEEHAFPTGSFWGLPVADMPTKEVQSFAQESYVDGLRDIVKEEISPTVPSPWGLSRSRVKSRSKRR